MKTEQSKRPAFGWREVIIIVVSVTLSQIVLHFLR